MPRACAAHRQHRDLTSPVHGATTRHYSPCSERHNTGFTCRPPRPQQPRILAARHLRLGGQVEPAVMPSSLADPALSAEHSALPPPACGLSAGSRPRAWELDWGPTGLWPSPHPGILAEPAAGALPERTMRTWPALHHGHRPANDARISITRPRADATFTPHHSSPYPDNPQDSTTLDDPIFSPALRRGSTRCCSLSITASRDARAVSPSSRNMRITTQRQR